MAPALTGRTVSCDASEESRCLADDGNAHQEWVKPKEARALTDAPSSSAIFQARLAAGLIVGLIVLGALWYGFSFESFDRLWRDILDRPDGPMTFRFVLQPAMAALAAFRDGIKDARLARTPYVLALLRGVRSAEGRSGRLWEGIVSTARILILGVVIDMIYQWLEFKTFYPAQSAVIAVLLAFVPYLMLRGPFERIARLWLRRPSASKGL
jgi:hypothetical protein